MCFKPQMLAFVLLAGLSIYLADAGRYDRYSQSQSRGSYSDEDEYYDDQSDQYSNEYHPFYKYRQSQSQSQSQESSSISSESEYKVFTKRTELRPREYMGRGQELVSQNGFWHLVVQNNQRIVLYKSSPRIGIIQAWSIHVKGLKKLMMTSKGRLRACAGLCGKGKSVYLSKKVCKCRDDAKLVVKNNGIVAIYSCGRLRWKLELNCADVTCPKNYHCEKKRSGSICCKKDKGPASNSTSIELPESKESSPKSSSSSGSSSGSHESCKDESDIVLKKNTELGDLWANQEWDKIASYYHEHAVFSIVHETITGQAGILNFFKTNSHMVAWALGSVSHLEKIICCETMVTLYQTFNYTNTDKQIVVVPYINVWVKQDGHWKLKFDFDTDVLPLPA